MLIWMASLASVKTCLLSLSIVLKLVMLAWVVVGNSVYVNCTGDRTIVFFYSYFQTSAGFSYVDRLLFSSGKDHV